IALVVENHGPTLSPEQQPRLSDRFWRPEASRHQRTSGLGLSIVRSIMRLHYWSCEESTAPAITRFTLCFPRSA
ncbi:sensor histidine kinase, partial [Pantoea brenneri]|uniref:sensor histidine kinase n=1 Tax=Pantoea brenneri TaxID=472694 RepID=UPI001F0A70E8